VFAFRTLAIAVALAALAATASAQSWPTKPVRIIVGFAAGGPSDTIARIIAEPLSKAYHQQFVVENRPGAGGNLAADIVAKAPPDGYTLFLSPPGPLTNHQFLYKNLPFDPEKDFTPIIIATDMPLVFALKPSTPITSIAELIAYAQKNPGKLNYASPGNGTLGHLAAELFKHTTHTNIVHIPYRGSAPAQQDLLAGTVDLASDNIPPYLRFIQSGALRALAVTTAKRWPSLIDVPTMQEAGLADFEASSWASIVGPAKLPAEIVNAVNRTLNDYLKSPEAKTRFNNLSVEPMGGSPEDFAKRVRAEISRWGPLIQKIGVQID
jgi:tripartite-type tricarboxylate transporter receptor subunit TctC